MPNSNIGRVIQNAAKGPLGADSPGSTVCGNCRQVVQPHATNGPSTRSDRKVLAVPTSAGYSCPACGHVLAGWTKSTGKAMGPVNVGITNLPTAPDM